MIRLLIGLLYFSSLAFGKQVSAPAWQVEIHEYGNITCKGSLINKKVILTSAHCLAHLNRDPLNPSYYPKDSRNFTIIDSTGSRHFLSPYGIKISKKFNPSTLENEIAVMVLENPVNIPGLVFPKTKKVHPKELKKGELFTTAFIPEGQIAHQQLIVKMSGFTNKLNIGLIKSPYPLCYFGPNFSQMGANSGSPLYTTEVDKNGDKVDYIHGVHSSSLGCFSHTKYYFNLLYPHLK